MQYIFHPAYARQIALHPQDNVTIDGEVVVVRKLPPINEGVNIPSLSAFISDLYGQAIKNPTNFSFDLIKSVFIKHVDIYLRLLSLATGKSEDFLWQVTETEAINLMMGFYLVNGDFLVTRIAQMLESNDMQSNSPLSAHGKSSVN